MTAQAIFFGLFYLTALAYVCAFFAGLIFNKAGQPKNGWGLNANNIFFWVSSCLSLLMFFVFYLLGLTALSRVMLLENQSNNLLLVDSGGNYLCLVGRIFVIQNGDFYRQKRPRPCSQDGKPPRMTKPCDSFGRFLFLS